MFEAVRFDKRQICNMFVRYQDSIDDHVNINKNTFLNNQFFRRVSNFEEKRSSSGWLHLGLYNEQEKFGDFFLIL